MIGNGAGKQKSEVRTLASDFFLGTVNTEFDVHGKYASHCTAETFTENSFKGEKRTFLMKTPNFTPQNGHFGTVLLTSQSGASGRSMSRG
jgi:hypothetical protein